MNCYGKYYGHKPECSEGCELAKFCKEANDPPMLTAHPPSIREYELLTEQESAILEIELQSEHRDAPECYSREDLLEVIGFMMSLDMTTLDFLAAKLRDPEISFSTLARKRDISRQAVHKFIRQRCERIPELTAVLQNRGHRNYINSQKGFMEEVCKIRKKVRAKQLNRQKQDSISSRSLICSNRNFDLSSMNMLKGAAILRPV